MLPNLVHLTTEPSRASIHKLCSDIDEHKKKQQRETPHMAIRSTDSCSLEPSLIANPQGKAVFVSKVSAGDADCRTRGTTHRVWPNLEHVPKREAALPCDYDRPTLGVPR